MIEPNRNRPSGADVGGGHGRSDAPQPPQPVRLAWWLWLASVVVGFVRTVVLLADRRMLIEQMRQVAPELSQSEVDAAANSGIMFTLLLALAIAAVYVLLANRMVQGRNWARIVVVVLASFSVVRTLLMLFGLVTLGSTVTMQGTSVRIGAPDIVFNLIGLGLNAAVLVLMLRPEAIGFFREARRRFLAQRASRSR
ncbi:hypothetical protein [Haloactinomyces albus]|uniref:Uncharacterized protein n=1 Tax=Haloactinomyces albus TaxID=1352928 RepID=A0AAE4CLK9_9ACTN|nr:hypothetical protein [Haloactinomyces albus]MDR7302365.1 hypothetical protein [Haloactinomyces albus]